METFETAGNHLLEMCLSDLSVYRSAAKTVQSPAVRKLVESIVAQKTDQLADLKTIIGSTSDASINDSTEHEDPAEIWLNPESLLKAVTNRENAFAEAIRTLATQARTEENRNALFTTADRSRKFASWTKDHLELLGLF